MEHKKSASNWYKKKLSKMHERQKTIYLKWKKTNRFKNTFIFKLSIEWVGISVTTLFDPEINTFSLITPKITLLSLVLVNFSSISITHSGKKSCGFRWIWNSKTTKYSLIFHPSIIDLRIKRNNLSELKTQNKELVSREVKFNLFVETIKRERFLFFFLAWKYTLRFGFVEFSSIIVYSSGDDRNAPIMHAGRQRFVFILRGAITKAFVSCENEKSLNSHR